ncbi:MAG: peptide deformylase [Peptoniphilaceae bacterium]
MAYRNIRIDDDPVLRKKSREVKNFNDRLKILINDMYETMDKANGVGLAAPQIGILKRLITVDDREGNRFAMINPVIKEKKGKQVGLEGCLSLPNKQGRVERADEVLVNYLDDNFEEKELRAQEFLARILQHEIDHLDGVLYSDLAKEMYVIDENSEEVESEI